jgi:hypothetical protein
MIAATMKTCTNLISAASPEVCNEKKKIPKLANYCKSKSIEEREKRVKIEKKKRREVKIEKS